MLRLLTFFLSLTHYETTTKVTFKISFNAKENAVKPEKHEDGLDKACEAGEVSIS